MKMNKVTSVEDYKIVSSFQSLRKTLLDDKFADRLEKPLAYWALPNDRRLPLAFLGRTIKDLLATPFEELSATPGIGQKKISSLVKLLSRATKDHPPAVPFGLSDLNDGKKSPVAEKPRFDHTTFDPSLVSEALWSQWKQTVIEHGLGQEKLGRLAPSLQALPTVIWHTPLGNYVNHTVAEIRQLKTHGEKRVRVVLEVFYLVHEMLSTSNSQCHLSLRIVPKFILPIESWIAQAIDSPEPVSFEALRDHLALPLLNQVKIDAGETIHELSEGRLGVLGPAQSVRQQSKRLGVTRARVYQLLEDCHRVMEVRWPEGQQLFAKLQPKLQLDVATIEANRLYRATHELFYPDKHTLSDEEKEDAQLVGANAD